MHIFKILSLVLYIYIFKDHQSLGDDINKSKRKNNQISNRLLHLKNKNKKYSTECSMHNAIQ